MLQRLVAYFRADNEQLKRLVDEHRRAANARPAFAKGRPKAEPKQPGRKPGKDYGTEGHCLPP